jgi:hypothetical protein
MSPKIKAALKVINEMVAKELGATPRKRKFVRQPHSEFFKRIKAIRKANNNCSLSEAHTIYKKEQFEARATLRFDATKGNQAE